MTVVTAIGLMSGTSLDGIDVALLTTDGERVDCLGPAGYRAYSEVERDLLRRALADARNISARSQRPGVLEEAESFVTLAHAEALETFLEAEKIRKSDVSVVGFHGQTVLHRPEAHLTVQIGNGAALATRLGLRLVYDFRAADVAAGGQGAPLVPVFHQALARSLDRPQPIAVLNIGGVANLTYIDNDTNDLIACDTGPGNALIDDFMLARTGSPIDYDGSYAAKGQVDQSVLKRMLANAFFDQPCPKSLDRDDFDLSGINVADVSVSDGAATLTAFTAAGVVRILSHLPRSPRSWIVAGGGAHNPTLVRMLADLLRPATVETADAVGWSSDSLEAGAFAYLAVRTINRLPITFPRTTGVPKPLTGGVVALP
ncbi:MAG TPA: anhydro-N-acetylmuramic acid kinase [Pseudolabrys sp.]|nr:anhydro-N-acetylmuramic acid kinase [Pseudolabrys sp.]